MGISKTTTKSGKTYVYYAYRDGKKAYRKYCGIEGAESTAEKLSELRAKHRAVKMRAMQSQLGDSQSEQPTPPEQTDLPDKTDHDDHDPENENLP